MKFVVYSKPECVYCDLAKGFLKKKNISFETKDFKEISSLSGQYPIGVKFPQIYLLRKNRRDHIGGYDDLYEYLMPTYDFEGLKKVTKQITRNLNNIIDYNFYPTLETRTSNLRHRPIGIGVQGLANVFFEYGIAFDSEEARDLNEDIFECIYFGAMEASMELAREREVTMKLYKSASTELKDSLQNWKPNRDQSVADFNLENQQQRDLREILCQEMDENYPTNLIAEELERDEYLGSYSSFIGSPLQKGKFQFDLWDFKPTDMRHNWSGLMKDIQQYGVRNSLLVAPMPTASTAQILGNYECFEPVMSNIYTRRVLAGEYMVMNDYLVEDLRSLNMWTTEMKDAIIASNGSIQNISTIPMKIKEKYKTVWELKQKSIIDMAADRGKYICQSQSLNLFLESPTTAKLTSMHFYAWSKGLKTGIYYLRSRPSSQAIQFTIQPDVCENCSG